MKGRKSVYDRPVQRNFTIEFWMDTLVEECKKFGIRPVDIVQAGLLSLFKPENKLPGSLMKSFVKNVQPKAEDLVESIEYFKERIREFELNPAPSQHQEELIHMPPRSTKWFEDFHAVKFLETGDYLLLEKNAYQEQPALFELQNDNLDLNWKKLPKYYAVEAVMKQHSQNGPQKGDVPA